MPGRQRHDVTAGAGKRTIKSGDRVVSIAMPQRKSAQRIVHMGAALGRVEMTGALEGELLLESLPCGELFAAPKEHEPAKPVKAHGAEAGSPGSLFVLRGGAGIEVSRRR